MNYKTSLATRSDRGWVKASLLRTALERVPEPHRGGWVSERAKLAVEQLVEAATSWIAWVGSRPMGFVMVSEVRVADHREGFIFALEGGGHVGAGEMASALLDRCDQEASYRGWKALRARLPVASRTLTTLRQAEGWHEGAVWVRRGIPDLVSVPRPQVKARIAETMDQDFVCELVECSLRAGLSLPERGCTIDLSRLARQTVAAILERGGLFLIAEDEGRRVGLAQVELNSTNELTGQREALLHDVYVPKELQGRGYAIALNQWVELAARQAGDRFISGSVMGAQPEETVKILSRVRTLGWLSTEVCFVRLYT